MYQYFMSAGVSSGAAARAISYIMEGRFFDANTDYLKLQMHLLNQVNPKP